MRLHVVVGFYTFCDYRGHRSHTMAHNLMLIACSTLCDTNSAWTGDYVAEISAFATLRPSKGVHASSYGWAARCHLLHDAWFVRTPGVAYAILVGGANSAPTQGRSCDDSVHRPSGPSALLSGTVRLSQLYRTAPGRPAWDFVVPRAGSAPACTHAR